MTVGNLRSKVILIFTWFTELFKSAFWNLYLDYANNLGVVFQFYKQKVKQNISTCWLVLNELPAP